MSNTEVMDNNYNETLADDETKELLEELKSRNPYEVDNEGQFIIYTGLYEWQDGSIHYEPEQVEEA